MGPGPGRIFGMTPKEARKRQQSLARERRLRQAEKQGAKKESRALVVAFGAAISRWVGHDVSGGPIRDKCPSCRAEVVVTFDNGKMHPGHAMPPCPGWMILHEALGTEDMRLTSMTNDELTGIPAV